MPGAANAGHSQRGIDAGGHTLGGHGSAGDGVHVGANGQNTVSSGLADKLIQNAGAVGQRLVAHDLGADTGGLRVGDNGNTGDSTVHVNAHHHGDGALRAGSLHVDGVAHRLTAGLSLIDGCQSTALSGGSGGHIVGQLHSVGEIVGLNDLLHSGHGLFPGDRGDLILGDAVDPAQQASHDHAGKQQGHSQLDDVLGVHIDLFLGLHFIAHFAAASFLSDFTTPKRTGLVYLSINAVQQFMTMME